MVYGRELKGEEGRMELSKQGMIDRRERQL